jgi:hypothetical protein
MSELKADIISVFLDWTFFSTNRVYGLHLSTHGFRATEFQGARKVLNFGESPKAGAVTPFALWDDLWPPVWSAFASVRGQAAFGPCEPFSPKTKSAKSLRAHHLFYFLNRNYE